MQIWISRDFDGRDADKVELWEEMPKLYGSCYEPSGRVGRCGYISTEMLAKMGGTILKPGRLRQVKSIEIVLEDEMTMTEQGRNERSQ